MWVGMGLSLGLVWDLGCEGMERGDAITCFSKAHTLYTVCSLCQRHSTEDATSARASRRLGMTRVARLMDDFVVGVGWGVRMKGFRQSARIASYYNMVTPKYSPEQVS